MTLFQPAEIADLAAVWLASLPETAIVQRGTRTKTAGSGTTVVWVTVAAVPCRREPSRYQPAETAAAGRVLGVDYMLVQVPAGTDVQQQDRVVCGGTTYEVHGSSGPRSNEYGRSLLCQEIA